MCEPVSMGIMAGVAVLSAVEAQDQQRMANNRQKEAIAKQDAAQKAAQDEADKLGPAAKSIDLTQDAQSITALKRNRIAMQNGIMGTVKTNSLSQAPATQVAKTTLGS